jgi:hypothetical protein
MASGDVVRALLHGAPRIADGLAARAGPVAAIALGIQKLSCRSRATHIRRLAGSCERAGINTNATFDLAKGLPVISPRLLA